MAAAGHIFKLSRTGEDGVSMRDKLKQIGRKSDLVGPPIPRAVAHVWEWFIELGNARTRTESGPGPISFLEIKAWADLTGNVPTPEETRLIKRLDVAYLNSLGD